MRVVQQSTTPKKQYRDTVTSETKDYSYCCF
uniref:Uncharacterized protein n=1 Tax=Anopheles quadriannulatus TaxID=34691 RepID=A0A182XTY1_ANOQN